MKKILIALLAVLMLTSAITACSDTPANIDINVEETALALIDGCKFDEVPAVVDSTFAMENLLFIDTALVAMDGDKPLCTVGVCSSTPEFVLVLKAIDEAAAKSINEGPVADLTDSYLHDYTNYGPGEIGKIESCVNKVIGEYVFLIISADNAAAENLLNDLIK